VLKAEREKVLGKVTLGEPNRTEPNRTDQVSRSALREVAITGRGCSVRQSTIDPDRWFFDFDAVAPGGRGGASVRLDPAQALASIDGAYKNILLPPRSTGGLIADGLNQVGLPRPAILEAYNVERTTADALAAGRDGQGTRVGNLLEDVVRARGGTVVRWQPIHDGTAWHLRVHISYP
jgi:hypothetical protein